ncbi:MAG: hypothetical protein QXJ94_00820 [Candidatus Bathyarchaeia archaeon]
MTTKLGSSAILAIVTAGILLTVAASGLLTVNKTIPATGSITTINVEVYSDSGCTQVLTQIDWGTVSPGSTVTKTIYIKNTGNAQMTLSMTTSNWNPNSANGPITITWNKEGATLAGGQSTTATITLTVASSISNITNFSVNIVITGTG